MWIESRIIPRTFTLFLPIIDEFGETRNSTDHHGPQYMYQAHANCWTYFKLPCTVIGGHWGKNKALKILCNCLRVAQLIPLVRKMRPDLAISHRLASPSANLQASGNSYHHDARLRARKREDGVHPT